MLGVWGLRPDSVLLRCVTRDQHLRSSRPAFPRTDDDDCPDTQYLRRSQASGSPWGKEDCDCHLPRSSCICLRHEAPVAPLGLYPVT